MEVGSTHSTAALGSFLELSPLEPLNRWPFWFQGSREITEQFMTHGAVRRKDTGCPPIFGEAFHGQNAPNKKNIA